MISKVKSNILNLNVNLIVIPVNTVGVMGKGLALEFKNKYFDTYLRYRNACQDKTLHIGTICTYKIAEDKYAIMFPTKTDWRYPSKIEYIETGLKVLKRLLQIYPSMSIAIPPLGCGCGGLDKDVVYNLIYNTLSDLDNEIILIDNK
jgi:O-acetyl-ADP-ribose deacetylase (regulator of RNase III)